MPSEQTSDSCWPYYLLAELKDLQLWKLRKREVEPGLGEEAVDEAGPVLHRFEPGLHQHDQLIDALLGEVGQGSLEVRPHGFSRFAIVQGALDRRVQARRLSAGRACFGWLSGLIGWEHAVRGDTGRRGRCWRGHSPWMTALPRVSEGELWTSFPEATRNDVLGLLSMLLERLAVSAGLAAEGIGGEHDASA